MYLCPYARPAECSQDGQIYIFKPTYNLTQFLTALLTLTCAGRKIDSPN